MSSVPTSTPQKLQAAAFRDLHKAMSTLMEKRGTGIVIVGVYPVWHGNDCTTTLLVNGCAVAYCVAKYECYYADHYLTERRQSTIEDDWYQVYIEPGIRDHVRLLRSNGFNTFSSCEKRMEVALDISIAHVQTGALDQLDELLRMNYSHYTILLRHEVIEGRQSPTNTAVIQYGSPAERAAIRAKHNSLAWWINP